MSDDLDGHDSGRSSPLTSLTLVLAKEMVKNQNGVEYNGVAVDNLMQCSIAAISVLQQNYEESELLNSLRMIESCLKKENGKINVIRVCLIYIKYK